jgi:hypothetical protein
LLATTADWETPPTITAFISAPLRKSILQNLYHAYKLAERTTLTHTFPPHTQVLLPLALTLALTLTTLGPLTGWTNHEYDVACKQTQLMPLYPGNRPSDVGVTLQPQASPAHAQPHTYLATIDVTITAAPKLPLPDTPVNPYKPYAAQPQRFTGLALTTNFMDDDMDQLPTSTNKTSC